MQKIYPNVDGGTIRVGVRPAGSWLHIDVTDNGKGMSDESLERLLAVIRAPHQDSEHNGLWNVYWRLRYRYGEQADMRLTPRDPGLTVTLVIPHPDVPGGEAP